MNMINEKLVQDVVRLIGQTIRLSLNSAFTVRLTVYITKAVLRWGKDGVHVQLPETARIYHG